MSPGPLSRGWRSPEGTASLSIPDQPQRTNRSPEQLRTRSWGWWLGGAPRDGDSEPPHSSPIPLGEGRGDLETLGTQGWPPDRSSGHCCVPRGLRRLFGVPGAVPGPGGRSKGAPGHARNAGMPQTCGGTETRAGGWSSWCRGFSSNIQLRWGGEGVQPRPGALELGQALHHVPAPYSQGNIPAGGWVGRAP